jgi:hypothetical protein
MDIPSPRGGHQKRRRLTTKEAKGAGESVVSFTIGESTWETLFRYRTPNSLPINRKRKDNCIFCGQDVLFCFRSIDPTLEKEVMTKAGEETLEKIAQVRIILLVYLWENNCVRYRYFVILGCGSLRVAVTLIRIRIRILLLLLILINVMRIWDHWSTDTPGLHFEPLFVHGPPRLYF